MTKKMTISFKECDMDVYEFLKESGNASDTIRKLVRNFLNGASLQSVMVNSLPYAPVAPIGQNTRVVPLSTTPDNKAMNTSAGGADDFNDDFNDDDFDKNDLNDISMLQDF